MVRFREKEIAKEEFYAAKRPIKICGVNVDNIVISKLVKTKTNSKYLFGYLDKAISKLVKTKTNSKYLFGYLDKAIRPLVLILPKISGYVKTFKVKEGNNKSMSFCIDDEKLLGRYKAIWTNIEDLKNIKLKVLPVYDDRYIKTKIRTYGDKIYTNFRGLNVSEDDIEYESFTVISSDSLLVYNKKCDCNHVIMDSNFKNMYAMVVMI